MEKRIYQILKSAGLVKSSSEAQALLDAGKVKVNGIVVQSMKYKVNTKFQKVTVNDKPVQLIEQKLYILLNKPKGYTCQSGEKYPFVLNLITVDEQIKKTLFVVGRLDRDSEGALLITNDGKLAHKILSPEKKISKTYEILVDGMVSPATVEKLENGVVITIELGDRQTKYRTLPAKCKIFRNENNATWIELKITEGKKRQVRKMCEVVGHRVLKLIRTKIGELSINGIDSGDLAYLKPEEAKRKLGL